MNQNSRASNQLRLAVYLLLFILGLQASIAIGDSDIEIASFELNPRAWVETFAPGQVLFTLRNNGPDDWVQIEGEEPRLLHIHVWISDDESMSADDLLVKTFTAPLEMAANSDRSFDLPGINRADLIVPSRPNPFFWYMTIDTEGFSDPNQSNNALFAPEATLVKTPEFETFAAFSGPEIITKGIEIIPQDCFVFNAFYGNNWRIQCNDGDTGFTATFHLEEAEQIDVQITHLSSAAASCPGGGYSPVSIRLNGEEFATDYDPAENHGGSHWYVTDTWTLPGIKGENKLDWYGGETCTHYWIQQLVVTPTPLKASAKFIAEGNSGLLTILGPIGASVRIETSTDLSTWEEFRMFENFAGSQSLPITDLQDRDQQFYRAVVEQANDGN